MTENSSVDISIVIPTYERVEYAIKTITYLLKQNNEYNIEIIVVDQSNSNSYDMLYEAFRGNKSVRVEHFEPPSLPAARNHGIRLARGEIVLFLDDDIVPYATLLKAHLSAYDDPSIGGVAGRVIEADSRRRANSKRPGASVTWWGHCRRNFEYHSPVDVMSAPGGNMSFRKYVLEKVGEFDVFYEGNATLEETDYGYRVCAAGYRIRYVPDAAIIHLAAPSGGCRVSNVVLKEYFNLRNTTRFFVKHKPLALFPFFAFAVGFIFFRRTFGHASFFSILRTFVRALYSGVNSVWSSTL